MPDPLRVELSGHYEQRIARQSAGLLELGDAGIATCLGVAGKFLRGLLVAQRGAIGVAQRQVGQRVLRPAVRGPLHRACDRDRLHPVALFRRLGDGKAEPGLEHRIAGKGLRETAPEALAIALARELAAQRRARNRPILVEGQLCQRQPETRPGPRRLAEARLVHGAQRVEERLAVMPSLAGPEKLEPLLDKLAGG